MSVKHVGVPKAPRVRINRGDPRPSFFSNIVKGDALQETPNGIARNGDRQEGSAFGIVGAENALIPWAPDNWPNGNRSGE